MTNREPVTTVNLDQYGDQAMLWNAVAERLDTVAAPGRDVFTVPGTVRPDRRPHVAPVGSLSIDGAWCLVTGPGTQKGRNLAHDPSCILTARLDGVDVVFRRIQRDRAPAIEDAATRVIDGLIRTVVDRTIGAGGYPAAGGIGRIVACVGPMLGWPGSAHVARVHPCD